MAVRRRRPAVRHAARARARDHARSSCRRTPATSRPGGCSAPTWRRSTAPHAHHGRSPTRRVAAVERAPRRRSSPTLERARHTSGVRRDAREVGARHALRRPGAHAHRSPCPRATARITVVGRGGRTSCSRASTRGPSAARWTRRSRSSRSRATLRTPLPRRAEDRRSAARPNGGTGADGRRRCSFTRGDWLAVRDRRRASARRWDDGRGPGDRARGDGDDVPRRRLRRTRVDASGRCLIVDAKETGACAPSRSSTGPARGAPTGAVDADPITTEVIRHGLNSAANR